MSDQIMVGRTEVELHILIKRDGRQLLGLGKIFLLREIHRGGSLRTAAKELKMSYHHAWHVIEEMNQVAASPVVVKQRGGSGGGGAVLTEYGKRILDEYQIIEAEVQKFSQRLNTEINL
jgi:molybdate transport system regulatory protein